MFARAKPSADLSSAGLFLSVFDAIRDPLSPWLPCPMTCGGYKGSPSRPCWCRMFGDRLSASVVNAGQQHLATASGSLPLYSETLDGLVT